MLFVALNEAADRKELILVRGGMCRFHLRRDGVVVIRELLVLPECRKMGVGTDILERIRLRHPAAVIRAVCPADYPANEFWRNRGFELKGYAKGANTWELSGEVRS